MKLPVVDLAEVGAGGGSIAEVRNGVLRVGPRSAGADPGPACYGRGGREPTITDADLLLGYLDPAGLAGDVAISPALARAAIETRVAEPLGIDVVEAARAVHEIANSTLAGAIRLVTVTRGIDPRRFALVAFGGAGPMHACRVADEFGIATVIVPWAAGVASAVGMVQADAGAERRHPFMASLDDLDLDAFVDVRARLEHDARAQLDGDASDASIAVQTFVGMSVRNQIHALDLPFPDGTLPTAVAALPDAFAARATARSSASPRPGRSNCARCGSVRRGPRTARARRPHPRRSRPTPSRPATATSTSPIGAGSPAPRSSTGPTSRQVRASPGPRSCTPPTPPSSSHPGASRPTTAGAT